MSFTVFPSMHLADGQNMHLVQGGVVAEPERTDPLETALWFQEQGAQWIHILVLDAWGYRFDPDEISRLIDGLAVSVQLSCGPAVTDDTSLARALSTGCARLNLGTVALADTHWCAEAIAHHPDRIGITLPVRPTPRGPRLAHSGRAEDGGDLWALLDRFDRAGCPRYAVTDVTREGAMTGPNLDLIDDVCARTDTQIVAAGGIATLDDLRAVAALAPHGVDGAIIGHALYTGAFTLPQALTATTTT
ncbi:HisA/HisF-related TIM barrel protein [Actinomadura sp. 6N118]|uniref:HisA/HisF-related TIM barrel protein n=1 Tax=Actinomadura sp. 6N118 TaxID=3375151 RepID=UPI0037BCB0E8